MTGDARNTANQADIMDMKKSELRDVLSLALSALGEAERRVERLARPFPPEMRGAVLVDVCAGAGTVADPARRVSYVFTERLEYLGRLDPA